MAKKYFARIGGEQRGPYLLEELPEAGVTPDTYIWCKGMDDWVRARHDGEVCRFFRRRIFDHEHPSSQNSADEPSEENSNWDSVPITMRGIVERSGTEPGPPQSETPNYNVPPRSRMVEAILVTLFCSIIGFIAVFYAYTARRAWNAGEAERSYELTRRAKMWIGISFFTGMISTAFLLRNLFS